MKIVIDNKIPFSRGVFEPYAQVVYLPGSETDSDAVHDADAIISRTRTICNEKLLKGSSVKAIATATIGYDHIDTRWCEDNGIQWSNAPGCNSWSVKQYICSVLAVLGKTRYIDFSKTSIGVVGVGNVGSKVAAASRALGMKVLLCDPPRAEKEGPGQFVSLEKIISDCDIISVHVPLDRQTRHLFDERRLSLMRSTQILINSSRGPVVDNVALKEALKNKQLAGAVLDVWEKEPEFDRELLSLLDLGTPHIAGYSADGKAGGTSMSVRYIASRLGIKELENWEVSDIPSPAQPLEFSIDAQGKSDQKVLSEAILYTYDVREDAGALKEHPEKFESIRGDYMVRREPSAFTLNLRNGNLSLKEKLEIIGFNVKLI